MSWLRRVTWLSLMIATLSVPVVHGLAQNRLQRRLSDLKLTVQRALQDYRVDQGRYIPRERLSGGEVIAVLWDFGFVGELPVNPWSGEVWRLDGREPDYLVYETDPNYETYALRVNHPTSDRPSWSRSDPDEKRR